MTNKVKVYDRFHRPAVAGFSFTKPSMTKQAFKDDCDLAKVVNNYINKGGLSSNVRDPSKAMFGDFVDMPTDFMEMQNVIVDAKTRFEALPSNIRERFNNDAFQLLKFVQDKDNYDEAVKLGLIDKKLSGDSAAEGLTPATPSVNESQPTKADE